jgi:hypothetical protein
MDIDSETPCPLCASRSSWALPKSGPALYRHDFAPAITRDAASMLLGAAAREARRRGYGHTLPPVAKFGGTLALSFECASCRTYASQASPYLRFSVPGGLLCRCRGSFLRIGSSRG